MKLAEIVQRLERIAPLRFAGSWDNVGLLIDPGAPEKEINTLFVTNDLTENVMTEAMDKASNKGLMIVSYHPPIFRPLKRISADNWKVNRKSYSTLGRIYILWIYIQDIYQNGGYMIWIYFHLASWIF